MTEVSVRRRHRADVVRRLAACSIGDRDTRRDSLSWRALGELPDWCAFDEPARRELRDLGGVVSLLPAVRRCVNGETLLALRSRIGAGRLLALRSRPYAVEDDGVELAPPGRLEAQLGTRGMRALGAALGEPIVRELLLEPLDGDSSATAGPDVCPSPRSEGGAANASDALSDDRVGPEVETSERPKVSSAEGVDAFDVVVRIARELFDTPRETGDGRAPEPAADA